MLVRPESNSRPPAWQPGAQSTELPVPGSYCRHLCFIPVDNFYVLFSSVRLQQRVGMWVKRSLVKTKNNKMLAKKVHLFVWHTFFLPNLGHYTNDFFCIKLWQIAFKHWINNKTIKNSSKTSVGRRNMFKLVPWINSSIWRKRFLT